MARTLLQLVQTACYELGVSAPVTLAGSVDPTALQLFALANREGMECAAASGRLGGWAQLRKDFTFTLTPAATITSITRSGTVATVTTLAAHNLATGAVLVFPDQVPYGYRGQYTITVISATQFSYTMPADPGSSATTVGTYYNAYSLPSDLAFWEQATAWDANFRWQLLGPVSEQEWKVMQYGISPVGPRIRYMIKDGYLFINPAPGTAQTDFIALSYISNQWCKSSAGTGQSRFAADTDTYSLDEETMILGLKWRYLRAKGLDGGKELQTYNRALDRSLGRDSGNRSLPLNASGNGIRLLNNQNVPDTGFGT